MEEKIVYTIKGIPVALRRPRFGKGQVWNSQQELFLVYGIYIKGQHDGRPLYSGPLQLDITFYFPIPAKKKKNPPYWHQFKPDLSNLIKLVEDCIQDVLYHDDCIISQINAKKIYDVEPRTEFTITELERI